MDQPLLHQRFYHQLKIEAGIWILKYKDDGKQTFYHFEKLLRFTLVIPLPPQPATVVSTFSHLRQDLTSLKCLAMNYINTINTYKKRKCRVLCFREEITNSNPQYVRINRIQISDDILHNEKWGLPMVKKNLLELIEV